MISNQPKKLLCFCVLFLLIVNGATGQSHARIDSLLSLVKKKQTDEQFIRNSFHLADEYMELVEYDSAQFWLNIIADRLPLKKPSLFHYFLSSRQAEVYYYNSLHRLGLQEAERALTIARNLKDSILIADSYNFIGLFYINLGHSDKAVLAFRSGIAFSKTLLYPSHYLPLSLPHHLYGNMAEAYEKLQQWDSVIHYGRHSMELAKVCGAERGVALAANSLGLGFFKLGKTDSALTYFNASLAIANSNEDSDVLILNLGVLAQVYAAKGKRHEALRTLESGFDQVKKEPSINTLFLQRFLNDAIILYRQYDETALLAEALQQNTNLLNQVVVRHNQQINSVLNASLRNETRLLNLQVKEANQQNEIANTRVYLLVSLLILLVAAFLFYRNQSKQKLAMARLQNKISRDLHDDVGSSLSSLQVYSAVAEKLMEEKPLQAKEMLRKISKESAAVLENIGDIVWSIKSEREQSLEERIKNFVSDVLGAANIPYRISIEEGTESNIRNLEARKSILLIIKEAVNNAMKYSKASYVSVSVWHRAEHLCIQVTDNGIGFRQDVTRRKGAGLSSMEQRTLALGGTYELSTCPGKGTTILSLLPLTKISDSLA